MTLRPVASGPCPACACRCPWRALNAARVVEPHRGGCARLAARCDQGLAGPGSAAGRGPPHSRADAGVDRRIGESCRPGGGVLDEVHRGAVRPRAWPGAESSTTTAVVTVTARAVRRSGAAAATASRASAMSERRLSGLCRQRHSGTQAARSRMGVSHRVRPATSFRPTTVTDLRPVGQSPPDRRGGAVRPRRGAGQALAEPLGPTGSGAGSMVSSMGDRSRPSSGRRGPGSTRHRVVRSRTARHRSGVGGPGRSPPPPASPVRLSPAASPPSSAGHR